MRTFNNTSFVKHSVLTIAFVFGIGFSATASAVFIDFETKQDGTLYTGDGDFFLSDEYDGVSISSTESANGAFVNLTNPANVGTDISGYYLNVGAHGNTPQTQLTLDFTTVVTEVSFDFAAPSGNLTVFAFDVSGASLGVFNYVGTDVFLNPNDSPYGAGHVDISGIGEIAFLEIEPSPNASLVIDNLNFSPVPVPAAVWLFGSGLIGLIGIARRKKA